MAKDTAKWNTQQIELKVQKYFWLNLIPLGLLGGVGYLFSQGELSLHHFPQGVEKLLWLSALSVLLMLTLRFLTYPFALWLVRSAKRRLKKTVPSITGEEGFLAFLLGIPLWLFRSGTLLFTWLFYLAVVLGIALSGIGFVTFFAKALYQTLTVP